MKTLCKRITALLLILAMSMSLLCTSVWAAETEEAVTEDSSAPVVVEEETAAEEVEEAEESAEIVADEFEALDRVSEEEPDASEAEFSPAETLENVTALPEQKSEELNQAESGTAGALTWTVDPTTKTLTISGTGAIPDYIPAYNEYAPWGSYYQYVESIVIESGVTRIGAYAFLFMTQTSSVSIPKTVTTIGEGAFLNCYALLSLTVPSSVTWMDTCCYGYNLVVDADGKITDVISQPGAAITGAYGSDAQAYADYCNIAFTANGIVAPQDVTCSSVAKGVKVSWTKIDGATGYTVYRGSTKVKTVTGTSYTDTGAKTNGKQYTYKIVANAKINGATKSSSKSTGSTTYFLTRATCSKVKQGTSRKVLVYWKKNAKSSGYDVRVSSSSKFTDSTTWYGTIPGASKTYGQTTKGFTKGKTYYVQVRAYKKVGSSYYYSAWSATKKLKIK